MILEPAGGLWEGGVRTTVGWFKGKTNALRLVHVPTSPPHIRHMFGNQDPRITRTEEQTGNDLLEYYYISLFGQYSDYFFVVMSNVI